MCYRKRIRTARVDKRYSQDYMASQLNICQQAYCKIECGHTDISVSRLLAIAKILEVKAATLLF